MFTEELDRDEQFQRDSKQKVAHAPAELEAAIDKLLM